MQLDSTVRVGHFPMIGPRPASNFPPTTPPISSIRTSTGFPRSLPAPIDYIREPYQYDTGANPTNNALLALAKLSNEDKHRSLHASVWVFKTLKSNVAFICCLPLERHSPPGRPALKSGTEVAGFACRITGPGPKMKMKVSPTVQIIIEDWADTTEMIEGLRGEVREILTRPKSLRPFPSLTRHHRRARDLVGGLLRDLV